MEPNAGDIYGLQQQRRMSKSNSRAHRMSVATGIIRLIDSREIRDNLLVENFLVKKIQKICCNFWTTKTHQ